jgi:hypothetical protein
VKLSYFPGFEIIGCLGAQPLTSSKCNVEKSGIIRKNSQYFRSDQRLRRSCACQLEWPANSNDRVVAVSQFQFYLVFLVFAPARRLNANNLGS